MFLDINRDSYAILFSFSSVQLSPHTRPRCPHRWPRATATGRPPVWPLPRAPSHSPRLTWSRRPNRKAPLPRWFAPELGEAPRRQWACSQPRAWAGWAGGGLTKFSTRPVVTSPTESSADINKERSHCQTWSWFSNATATSHWEINSTAVRLCEMISIRKCLSWPSDL